MNRYNTLYEISSVYRIKDPALYYIADRLKQFGKLPTNFKDIKKLNDVKLLQAFSKKTGQEFQRSIGSRNFDISDIINFDKSLFVRSHDTQEGPDKSIFKDPMVISKITKDLSTWTGAQRYITNLTNNVLQFNIDWNWLKNNPSFRVITEKDLNISAYIKNSNHPTSRTKLTLGWVRFTLLKPGYVHDKNWYPPTESSGSEDFNITEKSCILDEIQTDLTGDSFLGEDMMEGWENFIMQKFISFIRGSLGIRKIYMPTYEAKQELYSADPPMYLYKEIPNKFGFSKASGVPNFMLLEKKL